MKKTVGSGGGLENDEGDRAGQHAFVVGIAGEDTEQVPDLLPFGTLSKRGSARRFLTQAGSVGAPALVPASAGPADVSTYVMRMLLGSPDFHPVVTNSSTGMPIALRPRRPPDAVQTSRCAPHWRRINQRAGGLSIRECY